MFVDNNSIVVNNINLSPYLTEVEYQYPKLWGSDSGRNLAGVQSGTLIGTFPKLILHFRKLTKEELKMIVPILDAPNQTITYYDPNKQEKITITTYTGDYSVVNKGIVNDTNKKNEGFSCSFIAIEKRA